MIILIIVLLLLIIALFVKKEYTVKRDIVISRPSHDVYNYVKFQKNQDYYNKWVMQEKRSTFRGTDGTVGFVYSWDSDGKAGKGEQEITRLIENKEVDCEIRFEKPFKNVAYVSMTIVAMGDAQTKVKWAMNAKMKYPMNFMNLFIEGMLGKDVDESLRNLKTILEKQ